MKHINKHHYCTKCFKSKPLADFSDKSRPDTCTSCGNTFHNTNLERETAPKKRGPAPMYSKGYYAKVKARRIVQDAIDLESEFDLRRTSRFLNWQGVIVILRDEATPC